MQRATISLGFATLGAALAGLGMSETAIAVIKAAFATVKAALLAPVFNWIKAIIIVVAAATITAVICCYWTQIADFFETITEYFVMAAAQFADQIVSLFSAIKKETFSTTAVGKGYKDGIYYETDNLTYALAKALEKTEDQEMIYHFAFTALSEYYYGIPNEQNLYITRETYSLAEAAAYATSGGSLYSSDVTGATAALAFRTVLTQ
jgi:hypothetical protein